MVATTRDCDENVARTLRLSITGECNLSCFYCKPLGRARALFETKNLIQPSDVTKLVKIVGELGVTRVIIAGGEPLLRKDAANFVKAASAHKAIEEVRVVTNGTRLKDFADPLRKMGLRKIDVNFDSLDFRKYQRITGEDHLYRVLDGVDKVEKLHYTDIRLNILLLSGINDGEVINFSRMTKDHKVHLRFIEYHPKVASGDPYADRPTLSVLGVKRMIDNFQQLRQVEFSADDDGSAPAWQFVDGLGKISFVSRMELDKEEAEPRILFNADGTLSNEINPQRSQPILEELRRDAKEDRLHRMIEKIMRSPSVSRKPERAPAVLVARGRPSASKSRRAVATH
ncbi:MAG TPA: radical SAM protein [Bdellovibrionota bacterium]|nr:radical SAM protein [Bdellovibrionota bacterium]